MTAPAPTMRLDHVDVVVPDLGAATAFFCDALGFRPLREARRTVPRCASRF